MRRNMKVVVIGGGPAGMMAALSAAQQKEQVILIEKMNSCGRKLLITGKGRCNITSSLPINEFIKNIPGNGKFLYSSFRQYTNKDIIQFLEKQGVKTKIERGNRVFPVSDRSKDVLQAFLTELERQKVTILMNTKVIEIVVEDKTKQVLGVKIERENKKEYLEAEKVILATGGKSYPTTGSTGDGYFLAQKIGHFIIPAKGSLVPLEIEGKDLIICKKLQGLTLKNSKMKLIDKENKKVIYEDFGELLFTHFGVSGPTILSSSAHLLKYPLIEQKLKEKKITLVIDLKPALTIEKLHARIVRDFEQISKKQFQNALDALLPKKLIDVIISLSEIPPEKKVAQITKEERQRLASLLKQFTLTISRISSY